MHTHRFLLFDRPKPPKNVEIVDYDMEKGSAILEKKKLYSIKENQLDLRLLEIECWAMKF